MFTKRLEVFLLGQVGGDHVGVGGCGGHGEEPRGGGLEAVTVVRTASSLQGLGPLLPGQAVVGLGAAGPSCSGLQFYRIHALCSCNLSQKLLRTFLVFEYIKRCEKKLADNRLVNVKCKN